jgi:DEAD/DEAH box helicase domain-containing protein
MAMLIQRGVPTIAFSKAKMTAEMIHRYVCEKLQQIAPHLVTKVTPYRGGYRPAERREIERRLSRGNCSASVPRAHWNWALTWAG